MTGERCYGTIKCMKLYKDELMDHYRFARNRGELPNPDFASGQLNPSCGDQISIFGMVSDNVAVRVQFTGKGCVISQATASMLTQACAGKALAEIMAWDYRFIQNLIGIELGPTRLKCALLALDALKAGICSYQKKEKESASA